VLASSTRTTTTAWNQIGALGLVVNALVLFNTRYLDAAVAQLRADGFDVRDADVARLSPVVRHHVNIYLDTLQNCELQLDGCGSIRPCPSRTPKATTRSP
jgi:hypothetical protein